MRIFRRFGQALRGAITGIARAGRLRRPTEPPAKPVSPAAQDPKAPTPRRRTHAPRRPRTAPAPKPTRLGWLARWFGRGRRQPGLPGQPASGAITHAANTPGNWPSPASGGTGHTPNERPDPFFVRILLIGLAKRIVDNAPPEAKLNIEAVFSVLWRYFLTDQLTDQLGQGLPGLTPAAQPGEAAAEQSGAAAQPETQPEAPDAGSPASPATAGGIASESMPDTKVPAIPLRRRGRSLPHLCRKICRYCRTLLSHFWRSLLQPPPPPRRLFYAACAGPP